MPVERSTSAEERLGFICQWTPNKTVSGIRSNANVDLRTNNNPFFGFNAFTNNNNPFAG